MATTMIPEAPTPASTPGGAVRFVAIRANLLPGEIVSARQAIAVRKRVLVGLVVVVALLIGTDAFSWYQTSAANSDLDSAQSQAAALRSQQSQFAPLVRAQADVEAVHQQLQGLMADDVSFKAMLTTLRGQAPSGVALTSIGITVNSTSAGAAAGAAAPAPLNESGKEAIGQLTLSGTAPDKRSVAAYADRLATMKGLAAPLISSVSTDTSSAKFSLTAIVTSDALSKRYVAASTPAPTGGH
jgi:Tfp pilus assembly protein PilN